MALVGQAESQLNVPIAMQMSEGDALEIAHAWGLRRGVDMFGCRCWRSRGASRPNGAKISARELALTGTTFGEADTLGLLSGIGASLEKLSLEDSCPSVVVESESPCVQVVTWWSKRCFGVGISSLFTSTQREKLTRGSLERVFTQAECGVLQELAVDWQRRNVPVPIDALTHWIEKQAVTRLIRLSFTDIDDRLATPSASSTDGSEAHEAASERMLVANKTLEQLYCIKSKQSWDIRASLELYNGEDVCCMATFTRVRSERARHLSATESLLSAP